MILYFLRERITQNNLEIKHLVVTNINEWFVFDASVFEKAFAQNKALVKDFKAFEEGRLSGNTTDFFYKEIASREIDKMEGEIPFTYFDLRDYDKPLRNSDKRDDVKLIALFKLLSPEHLLKLPFTNDSNSLDKRFYSELLHIIGLSETKEGGKKLIGRNKSGERHSGSILENAIVELDSLDKIGRLGRPSQYGDTNEERLFNVGLELGITWINRILFLKLLEAQLITYHKGDKTYSFLNLDKIKNYDDLNSLFFKVLARKYEDRSEEIIAAFGNVPYLNSSLFEPTDMEHNTLFISNLRDEKTIPIISSTVLKNDQGKKRTGNLSTLEYLFEFLDAYDFSSEGSEDIQEENKTLINASVLGLIFEKINGYKDGSFFTPGFITMYMCRETIRRAVVQKFKEAGFKLSESSELSESLGQIYDQIEDRKEANEIVNSIKICDPAVGSGHFLVSALNEIIAIKNDLKILQDRNGRRLKEYQVEVVNDELVVTDEEGQLFEYNPNNKESQRIQETLFHEKQEIIENCLFGVDINPNSVKICRLRLWIELLKSAYYKVMDSTLTPQPPLPKGEGEDFQHQTSNSGSTPLPRGEGLGVRVLETLPNIDINIKCGNSLVSRFAIDADLSQALKKSKFSIDSYRSAVSTYRNAQNKEEKREMERLIAEIKSDFRSEIASNDPKIKRKAKLGGELYNLTMQTGLFEESVKEKKDRKKKIEKIETELEKLSTEIEEIKNNKIYENAFEWRFEFPEVLNETGDFVGFDVVIGNPPYVYARGNFDSNIKEYFYKTFITSENQINLYVLFLELAFNILENKGSYSLIVPNSVLMVSSTEKLRSFIFSRGSIHEVVNFMGETFEGVNVETVTLSGSKSIKLDEIKVSIAENSSITFSHIKHVKHLRISNSIYLNVFSDNKTESLLNKIKAESILLDDLVGIKAGLKAYQIGKGKPKQTAEEVKNRPYDYSYKYDETTFPYLEGKDINRYGISWSGGYLRFGEFLAEPRMFLGKKVIIREITGKTPYPIFASYTDVDFLFNMSNIAIIPKSDSINLKYILALINSKLIGYYFLNDTAKSVRKMFPKLILKDLRQFPIKQISLECQGKYIDLVDNILETKEKNPTAETTEIENQIDKLVYELYGLTEEEIRIVEGGDK